MTHPACVPPVADRRPARATHHGVELTDDYAWLRDDDWRQVMRAPDALAADIKAHLEAENAHVEALLGDTDDLQQALIEEMKGRIKQDDRTPPSPDGPFAYFIDYVTGGEHPRYCRQPRDGGAETVLVDGDALAEGLSFFKLGGVDHSPDHRLVCYGADRRGSEYYSLTVVDAESGETVENVVEDTSGSIVWAADSKHFFYTRLDEDHRPSRVYLHALGTAQDDDRLIYEESDPGFFVGVGETQSRAFVTISSHDHETSEVYLIRADDPEGTPVCVAKRETGHEYDVEHHGDRLVILTNSATAEDFRIVSVPVAEPGRENWTEIVAHRPGRLILSVVAFAGHLVRLERENGLPRIVVTDLGDDTEHEIAFDEAAYALGLMAGYEFDTTTMRFSYSSMTTPSQVYDYDMASRARTLIKTQEVPSGHDPDEYVTRRITATAPDGETVPISLLHRRDTALDGSAPALLYGYGAYGISIPASFSTNRLSLVDRGFVYAIAHIRGGKDKGYGWYRDGKNRNKVNSFTDFIAAARGLVLSGITAPDRLIAHGGSAGGMLMGAVANMAPDDFAGIVAEVPFVDVLNTMLDASLPLTPPEWPEWGNPIESAEDFERIASWSPYENVKPQAYPHILALAGLTDPRVTYWEPAKWIARLRRERTDDGMTLLKTDMTSGHGGAAGRFDSLKDVALIYAFALKIADLARS